ncbi:MAG: lipopolysaccharide biosynthesis protein [Hydrogenophaga sp.]|nr:lipopolysaccharide biosynthesis protein [Hydrogenophaga sp.]
MAIDRYWRNVGSVLTGAVVAQIIPIVGTLVIARQYAPAEFGIFAAWLGIVYFIGVLLTGRFETAFAIVPDGEPRRIAVITTVVTATLAAFVAAVVCSFIFRHQPSIAERQPTELVILLIPAALAVALAQIWQSWAAAEGNYRKLSYMRIAQAASITLGQITAGFISPSAATLAIAHIVGVMVGIALSAYIIPPGRFPRKQALKSMLNFWSQHRRFPIFSLPADGIKAAAAQLPVILIAARFGSEIAGLLALTMRTLGVPIGLLGRSVLDVFKRQAAATYLEQGECRTDYMRTFRVLAIASIGFSVVLASISESFFAMAFGENWVGAGTIALWLLPLFALRFIASPLSYMVYIAGKQHVDLIWQATLLAVTFAALNIPLRYDVALQAYSAGYSLLYIVYLVMSYRFSLGVSR